MLKSSGALSGSPAVFSSGKGDTGTADMKRREVGILGERIAQSFLEQNGYNIVETNYRCSEGEIDVIARREDLLVFVEVRTRRSNNFGSPEESITAI